MADSLKTLLQLKGFEVEVVYDGEDGADSLVEDFKADGVSYAQN